MGAWGEKAFQNDSALDWVAELKVGGVATLRATLSRVASVHADDYLDVDDGTCAIAAAEIVAAALQRRRDRVTAEIGAWLDAHGGSFDAADQLLARRAVKRVLAAGSELRELREENAAESAWHADVRELLRLLGDDGSTEGSTEATGIPEPASGARFEREKQALVTFLHARGLRPSAQQLARIEAARDPTEIRAWLARVVTAASVAEVLDGS